MQEGQSSVRQEPPNIPSGTVTFLFTDIEGSTKLLETLREQYARVLEEHRQIFRAAFEHWNGLEIDTLGDSFFVAFGRAMYAVQCVIEARRELMEHEWPQGVSVRVRMGLHTGEPLISKGEPISNKATLGMGRKSRPYYIGMDVHRAARIASAGHGGQVLLSQTTRDLIYQDLPEGVSLRDLGLHTLKDIRLPQRIYQLDIRGLPVEFPPLKTLSMESALATLEGPSPAALDGEKETEAYRNLLKQWHTQGRKVLDKASMTMLFGAPTELILNQDDQVLLLRSALQYGLEVEPWMKGAGSETESVAALDALLQEYPRPQSRMAIVEALCGISNPLTTPVLMRVAATDDAQAVRSRAALEVASRGQYDQVMQLLAQQSSEQGDLAAIAAMVAVIDEYGSPKEKVAYPRFPVVVGLAQRRWRRGSDAIRRRSLQGVVGGGLALGLLGCFLYPLAGLVNPVAIEANRQFISVSAWILSGAIVGLLWGGLQGVASGFTVQAADVFWPSKYSGAWRFVAGGLAGMVFSALMILFASAGLISPAAGPQVYVPVFLVYGFLQGGALSWVIPRLGAPVSGHLLTVKVFQTSLFIGLVAIPAIFLVYQESSLTRLPIDGLYAVLMPSGMALATRKG
jgi:class 3 adenylate cyclase